MLNMITKTCSTCGIEKDESFFGKSKKYSSGLRYQCNECRKQYYHKNHEKILKQKHDDYEKHKEQRLKDCAKYRKTHRKEMLEYFKRHYQENREKILQQQHLRKISEPVKARRREHYKNVLKKDVRFMIEKRLRNRLRDAVKKQSGMKHGKYHEIIGCNYETLKKHIESKFTEGQTWEKLLNAELHLDHIIPCDAYDLTKESEQRKCFSYRNIQPLWETHNLSKLAKIPPNQPFDLLPEKLQEQIKAPYREKLKLTLA